MYQKIRNVNKDSMERHIRDIKSVHQNSVTSSSGSKIKVGFEKNESYLEFIRDKDKSRLIIKGIRKGSDNKFYVNNIYRILTAGRERLYMDICFDDKENKTFLLADD